MLAGQSSELSTVGDALRARELDPIDARVLLEHVLGAGHAELIAHRERRLTAPERDRYAHLVERRRHGEPIAYLIGWREFYGRRFAVDPAVLIPRPESELLVELALQHLGARAQATVLDLGTGSGNLAVTIALERPDLEVFATDISESALACARRNARDLGARIQFKQGDWFAPVAGRRFDLIVSNPPYVADADLHLSAGDLRFEPQAALRGGPDGLACLRSLVERAPSHLWPGGWLIFEHGYDQAVACAKLLDRAGFADVSLAKDLAGLPRVSAGRMP